MKKIVYLWLCVFVLTLSAEDTRLVHFEGHSESIKGELLSYDPTKKKNGEA